MNTALQISNRMSISINNLSKKHGILSIDYQRHTNRHYQNVKYWDKAECTSLNTGRVFTVNHYGEITEGEKAVNLRRKESKGTEKVSIFATV